MLFCPTQVAAGPNVLDQTALPDEAGDRSCGGPDPESTMRPTRSGTGVSIRTFAGHYVSTPGSRSGLVHHIAYMYDFVARRLE